MKKDPVIPFIFLLVLCYNTVKATNLNGNITTNTMLTKVGNPYIVDANLHVTSGAILTIEPGVIIKIVDNVHFTIDGGIKALGTKNEPIYFTQNGVSTPYGGWFGLDVNKSVSTDSVIMDYCVIENGQHGLAIDSHPTKITNSVIKYCFTAINIKNAFFDFQNNITTKCSEGIVLVNDCTANIVNNELLNINSYAIYALNNIGGEIKNNKIIYGGIGIQIGICTNSNPLYISNNIISNKDYGMIVYEFGKLGQIKDNVFSYNTTALKLENTQGYIIQNTFKYNQTALNIQAWSNQNIFFNGNCIDSNSKYNVVNNFSKAITLSNNYWGTIDTSVMYAKTYDNHNHPLYGKIYYSPFASQPYSSCKVVGGPGLTNIVETKLTTVNTYPNPCNKSFSIQADFEIKHIQIYNSIGVLIFDSTFPDNQKTITVNTSAVVPGLYTYRIITINGAVNSGHFIKE